MLTKRFFTIFLLSSAFVLAAQGVKPMTDEEFSYYEFMINSGQADNYRKPVMQKDVWEKLVRDINTQVIEAKIPKTIDGWKEKGKVQVPSRNQIRLLAFRLRAIISDPELPEVSGMNIQWFKNIGNGFIVLENYQKRMIAAVEQGKEKEYGDLYYSYTLSVKKLKTLINDRDKWELSRKEQALIQKKNLEMRRKKLNELAKRYEYTRKLKKDNPTKNKKQPKNDRKGAKR